MNDLNYMKLIIWYYTNNFEPYSIMQHRLDEHMMPLASRINFDARSIVDTYLEIRPQKSLSVDELRDSVKPEYKDLFDTALLELQLALV